MAFEEVLGSPVTVSGCEAPRVPMVEPTHPRQSYKGAMTRFPSLYRPHLGRVLPQSIVNPIRMIVAEVFTNQPPQVGFIELGWAPAVRQVVKALFTVC